MNDFRSIIIAVTGAFFALLSPIQDFMAGMLILFVVNFVFGLLAAIFNGEEWSWRKAGMCFVYCLIFFATAASMFIVGTSCTPKNRRLSASNTFALLPFTYSAPTSYATGEASVLLVPHGISSHHFSTTYLQSSS